MTCDMSTNFIYSDSRCMIIMLHKVTLPTPTRKRQKPRQKRKPSSLSPSPSPYLTGLAISWGVDWASVTSTLLRAASVADLEPEKTSKLLNLELRIHLGIFLKYSAKGESPTTKHLSKILKLRRLIERGRLINHYRLVIFFWYNVGESISVCFSTSKIQNQTFLYQPLNISWYPSKRPQIWRRWHQEGNVPCLDNIAWQ